MGERVAWKDRANVRKRDRPAVRTAAELEQKWSGKIKDAEGNSSEALQTAKGFEERVKNAEGAASEATQTAQGFEQRVSDAEGNASRALQTAQGFEQRVADAEGNISKQEQTSAKIAASVESVKKTSEEALKEARKNATDLSNYANQVSGSLTDLQNQIDGAIETWFDNYEPTTANAPASSWTTTEDKNKHLGDLFYIVDNEDKGGLVYRWALTNGVYGWVLVEDTEVAKALETASKAKDTADGKRRVFVAQPKPPYDVGDLWTNNTDLYVCKTARAEGSYTASDWKLATEYTTEKAVKALIEVAEESITLQVQSVEKKVDGIEVGGRNLIAGTDNTTIYTSALQSGELYRDTFSARTIAPPDGTEYIVSFDAKADVDQLIYCFFYSPNTTISSESSTGHMEADVPDGFCPVRVTTEWKRYWVRWKQTPADENKAIIIGRADATTNVYIRAIKLEKGNTATDWTPAPEDTEATVTKITNDTIATTNVVAQNLHVKAANIDGALTFGSGSYYIDPGATETYLSLPGITVNKNGTNVNGNIVATSGCIGAWNILQNGILGSAVKSGDNWYGIALDATDTALQNSARVFAIGHIGSGGESSYTDAASGSWANAAFSIRADGSAEASNLTITGGKAQFPTSISWPTIIRDGTSIDGNRIYLLQDAEGIFMSWNVAGYADNDNSIYQAYLKFSATALDMNGTVRVNGSAIVTGSDARWKNTVEDFTPAHDILFDHLRPRTYQWNEGTSGRTHSGFIVQEVVDAVDKAGLTTKDFAAVVNFKDENGEDDGWGLRYEEMISLNTWQIQKLKARIAELEERLNYEVN